MIWRTLTKRRVWLGYFLSVASASVTLLIVLNIISAGLSGNSLILTVIFMIMTLYTIVPALFFIVISERRNNRALVTYLFFSGLLAVIAIPLVTMDFSADTVIRSLVFLPAGLVSGFVYWWFSGRHAGDNIRELRKQIEVFD